MSIHTVRCKIKEIRQSGLSWRETGKRLNITGGLAYKIAVDGYEPKLQATRDILGLEKLCNTTVILCGSGTLPPGTQVIMAEFCAICNRPYISNHPRRKRCFMCRPYKARKDAR